MSIFLVVKSFYENMFIFVTNLDYQSLEGLDETDHDLDGAGDVDPLSQAHLDVECRGDVRDELGCSNQY